MVTWMIGSIAPMLQFIFGLMAGLLVGLVMEWIVDWQALAPKVGFAARRSNSRVDATVQPAPSHQVSADISTSAEPDNSAHRE
jgi:hypothetical protein